jgi:hypothetical protein
MKPVLTYRGADKSLARPTSRCILLDENISFDAGLVVRVYINGTNIPPIMIINMIYEHQNLVVVACFLPGRAKDLSAPLYVTQEMHPILKYLPHHYTGKRDAFCFIMPNKFEVNLTDSLP